MDNFQSKIIGYAVVAIIAYFIMQAFMPYLICGVIGWIMLRAYENNQKRK
jgi:hypothetical protein